MVSSSLVKSATLAVTLLASTADAHNQLNRPLPTWPPGVYNKNSPSGTIDPAKYMPVPSGMSYTTDYTSNANAYWTAFNASSYKSLKEFAFKTQKLSPGASKECGFSIVDGVPQDLPDMIQWDFFTASHTGPLENYCDDTLVSKSWNAAVEYPESPANVPFDKAKCKGASVLTSIWIALHTTPWQIYTNCAPLTGGSPATQSDTSTTEASTDSTSDATSPATAETPVMTPAADTVDQTEAATEGTEEGEEEEEEPLTTDETTADVDAEVYETEPPAAPPAPVAPTTDKCSVRRRRQ